MMLEKPKMMVAVAVVADTGHNAVQTGFPTA